MRLKSLARELGALVDARPPAGTTSASTKRATAAPKVLLLGGERDHAGSSGLLGAHVAASLRSSTRRSAPAPAITTPYSSRRRLDRHVVVEDVVQDAGGVALERIAVAAGARLLERDHVAVRELARLLAVHDLLAGPGVDHGARRARPGRPPNRPYGAKRWRSERFVSLPSSARKRRSRRTPQPPRNRPGAGRVAR